MQQYFSGTSQHNTRGRVFLQARPPFGRFLTAARRKHLVVTKTKSQLVTVGTTVEESTPQ